MGKKKILILVLVGALLSVLFFGGIIYFTFFRTPQEEEIVTYQMPIGEFVANLGSTRNYFQANITLEVTDSKLIDSMEEKHVEIRDIILGILIGKKADELLTPQGKSELKQEIISAISILMDTDEISNLYFTNYIIQ